MRLNVENRYQWPGSRVAARKHRQSRSEPSHAVDSSSGRNGPVPLRTSLHVSVADIQLIFGIAHALLLPGTRQAHENGACVDAFYIKELTNHSLERATQAMKQQKSG